MATIAHIPVEKDVTAKAALEQVLLIDGGQRYPDVGIYTRQRGFISKMHLPLSLQTGLVVFSNADRSTPVVRIDSITGNPKLPIKYLLREGGKVKIREFTRLDPYKKPDSTNATILTQGFTPDTRVASEFYKVMVTKEKHKLNGAIFSIRSIDIGGGHMLLSDGTKLHSLHRSYLNLIIPSEIAGVLLTPKKLSTRLKIGDILECKVYSLAPTIKYGDKVTVLEYPAILPTFEAKVQTKANSNLVKVKTSTGDTIITNVKSYSLCLVEPAIL